MVVVVEEDVENQEKIKMLVVKDRNTLLVCCVAYVVAGLCVW